MNSLSKRLLVVFALLGVVGTAGAFAGGALPGPAVGVSALYCALTGCTMTGQTVYSGVTTEVSTGANENFTVAPNGTGVTELVGNLKLTLAGGNVLTIGGGLASNDPSNFGTSIVGPKIGAITVGGFNNYGLLLGMTGAATAAQNTVTLSSVCTPSGACSGAVAAASYGTGLFAYGNTQQTQTFAAAGNLDPTSSRILLTCPTAASSFAVTMQETTVAATPALSKAYGADVTICSSPASNASCTLTFADVANVFNGAAPALLPSQCFKIFYANAADPLWLQQSPVSAN
jgi:hypothetical protein